MVEDEAIVGDLLVEVLAAEGCEVDAVENGRQALERVRTRPFDLIVCDVRMPDLDGPAFFQALETVDPDLARRVVFVTGDTMRAETREFLERTGVAYLEKPFDLADLRALPRRASGTL